jgi:uracil-DNA glycosylase
MSQDSARQAQYLHALGVDRWVPRGPLPGAILAPANHTAADNTPAWEQLAGEVSGCVLCGLHVTRTQTVFGVGNRHAELLVIGEAPGADEDRQGEPFVGRAGQLLNSMLRAMRTPRETVYIANLLKCRPPGNREPAPEEVRCCQPYLRRQIELLQPRLLLAVGGIAAQNLLATDTPVSKLRGIVHRYGEQGTPLIVTYHPAYLLRSPTQKRRSWQDLRLVRRELARLRAQPRGA